MAFAVTDMFDVIIYAEHGHMKELHDLIAELHTIDGISSTRTAIAISPRIEKLG